jgi:hypothetical protein
VPKSSQEQHPPCALPQRRRVRWVPQQQPEHWVVASDRISSVTGQRRRQTQRFDPVRLAARRYRSPTFLTALSNKSVTRARIYAGGHGGARSYKYDDATRLYLDLLLWSLLKSNPATTCQDLATTMSADSGLDIRRHWISRRLREWGWSWKKCGHKQVCPHSAER